MLIVINYSYNSILEMESFINASELSCLDLVDHMRYSSFYALLEKSRNLSVKSYHSFNELVGVDSGDTIHVPEGGNAVGSGGRHGSLYIKIKAKFFIFLCQNICCSTPTYAYL